LEDTPAIRGMIQKVAHLVQIIHDPPCAKACLQDRFTITPDFKLVKDGGYCEMESPRDDFIFEDACYRWTGGASASRFPTQPLP